MPEITSDLAIRIDTQCQKARQQAEVMGTKFLRAYVGLDIQASFRVLTREQKVPWFDRTEAEIRMAYQVGPNFTFNGIDYFVVDVREHFHIASVIPK